MGRLNHHAIDNGDIEVCPSDYPLGSTDDSVPDPNNTLIKYIDGDEMDRLLKLFFPEHDDGLLGIDLQILQD